MHFVGGKKNVIHDGSWCRIYQVTALHNSASVPLEARAKLTCSYPWKATVLHCDGEVRRSLREHMGANVFHISMDYGEQISYRISFIIILLLVF